MEKDNPVQVFVEGAIPVEKLSQSVQSCQSDSETGAHSIFLGQVRADRISGKTVTSIEFSAYEEMAQQVFNEIREEAFSRFNLKSAYVLHSLGRVTVGEICFYVFTSSTRRKTAIAATEFFVENIKSRVPIFGKEHFEDRSHQWKVNN